MNEEQLRIRIEELRKLTSVDIERVNAIIQEIQDGGWTEGAFTYRNKVEKGRRGRPLKIPRWQWHMVGHWFKGEQAVWYYNNIALSKAYAVNQVRSRPVPDWFKAQTLNNSSEPSKLLF
jgi:hypothetical protein